AELIVNDAVHDSVPDLVMVTTQNTPPVAHARADQTVLVGDTVNLDGGGSSDADRDPLTHRWSLISVPSGSEAALSDPGVAAPTFVVDRPGIYVAQLIVNDGSDDSAPDTVVISTANSCPVADGGADQSVLTGVPTGSTAVPSDSNAVAPTFRADLGHLYLPVDRE
ncbi:MAG: PKD domain-containing protein, partial [Methylococcaceae bacterium]|nr:PKD domain-containing protein [Methylococcaceae bacterium]